MSPPRFVMLCAPGTEDADLMPSHQEPEDAVLARSLDELIAGGLGPRGEVGPPPRIGGHDPERLAAGEVLDCHGCANDGKRARLSANVERASGGCHEMTSSRACGRF